MASPVLEEVTKVQRQVQSLLEQELYESAEILGSFLICRSKSLTDLPLAGPGSHSESLEVYADALFHKKEYRRALRYYREAEQHRKSGSLTRLRSSSSASSSSNAPDTVVDADLKFKECKCFMRLDEVNNALRSLVAVAPKQRSPAMNMTLGSLYKSTGLTRDAINSYKAGLKQNPLAVEAIIALAELGVSGSDIWTLITKSFSSLSTSESGKTSSSSSSTSPTVALKDVGWLEAFVSAHTSSHGQRTSDAIHKFGDLEKVFKGNMHCLLHKAKLQVDMDSLVEAQATFNRARETDPDNLEMMDYFAVLLRHKGTCGSLNSLAHRLMMIDQRRPEPWIAVSLYSDMRGDREKALNLVEQALQNSPNHVLGYHIKGTLLLSMGRADHAQQAFMHANKLQKDIHSFKGLVDSFLALHKLKEALATAKEALALMQRNPKAITLVGRVLAHLPDGRDKAKKAFLRALNIDPLSVDAALALADLYIAAGEYDKCIELLRDSLKHHNYDFLHTKIAQVYTLNEQYDEALTYFHTAISMNPNSPSAAAGLERLEKIMRGGDPDAEEDGMDDDDAVASALS